MRVNGKVSGVINGINFTDFDLQAYVVPKDGRSYTALSRVPLNVGYDMQSLNILGTTIGWLFAKPTKGALNGYQITGMRCIHHECILSRKHQTFAINWQ